MNRSTIGIIIVICIVTLYAIINLFSFSWKSDYYGLQLVGGSLGYNDVPPIALLQEANGSNPISE